MKSAVKSAAKPAVNSMIEALASNYQFKNPELLTLAVTHRSAKAQIVTEAFKTQTNNEQLEFVGDGLLNFVIAEELFKLFPQDDEGLLSKKRSHLVDQKTLCQKALDFSIDQFLVLGPGEREQESHKKPRVLASALEAIIAAIYYDSNFETAKKFVLEILKHNISEVKSVNFDKDFKTQLQELTQQRKMGLPVYREISSQGPSHEPQFLIALEIGSVEMARAVGTSKKRAEQLAAEKTYQILLSAEYATKTLKSANKN